MLKRQFAQHECPLAQALGEIGDGWTLQIIREAIYGTTQFEAFRANTGASRGLLADRLAHLTAAAILRKTKGDSDGRETFYELTQKGRDLWPVLGPVKAVSSGWRMGSGPIGCMKIAKYRKSARMNFVMRRHLFAVLCHDFPSQSA